MASMTEQPYNMFQQHENEDYGARYPSPPQAVYTSGPLDLSIPADAFGGFPRSAQDVFPTTMAFEPTLFAEAPNYYLSSSSNGQSSPGLYPDDSDLRLPSSSLSTASAPSAASSAIGSPQSNPGHMGVPEWGIQGLGVQPTIVGNDYMAGPEYSGFPGSGMEELAFDFPHNKTFVGESHIASSVSEPLSSSTSSSTTPTLVSQPTMTALGGVMSFSGSSSASSTSSPVSLRRPGQSATAPSETCSYPEWPEPHASASSPQTPNAFSSLNRGGVSEHTFNSSCWSLPRASSSIVSQNILADPVSAATDPSMIHPEINRPMPMPGYEAHFQHPYPTSPSVTSSPHPTMLRTNSSSPFLHNGPFQPAFSASPYAAPMNPNTGAFISPTSGEYHSGDESKEKQRCTYPDCGKVFKDLKAHMLTHQNERPEKCPIQTCEYHVKGFARKYDKNRHTLTHYKGTMVCGFCPGSGSAAEKSFNRADVFKRHLTAVHGVEQTPPNSRKKTSSGISGSKKLTGYAPDATGKCSTCSQTFSNAQDFYEHLDDCVLRIVQQEDPAEAINAQRLAEVENDKTVHQTLEKNNLPTTTQTTSTEDDDEDFDMGEDDDSEDMSKPSASPISKKKTNPANGVQKSRGLTHSRGGVALATKTKGRKNRRDYPSSWGFDKGQMTMKKRVMAVFDGPRRLAKDDMMLSTDHEVRIKLSDGKSYVTDLDVQTLKRAEAFHNATDEEKGPWISDDPTEEQLKEMQLMLETNTSH
ncbi:Transcription factor Sp2 [Paramyrothecium foliicola]|nr:Transcription factor Sp2 [Paramyrothecium foliicola]